MAKAVRVADTDIRENVFDKAKMFRRAFAAVFACGDRKIFRGPS
jgi:hypothetical protein